MGLAGDCAHRAPRNNTPVPKSSPALGQEGSAPSHIPLAGNWPIPSTGVARGALSALISIFWGLTFSCTTSSPGFQPHIKGSRGWSLSQSTALLCPILLGGLCCPGTSPRLPLPSATTGSPIGQQDLNQTP